MKKLLLALCLCASVCFAQTKTGGIHAGSTITVAFSATPTFDGNKADFFKITLTGNVTSSTLSNYVIGSKLVLEVCQDGTGGRTFVPPTNVNGWVAIQSGAGVCTTEFFWFDGTNAQPDWVAASIVNGVSFPASPSTHSVPVVTAANVITYKVIPDCQDSAGNHLNYTQSTDAWSCGSTLTNQVVTLTGSQALTNKTLDTASNTFKVNGTTVNEGMGVVTWGCTGTFGASNTFTPFWGVVCATSVGNQIPVAAGTFKNLFCHANTGGVNASSGVVTVRKNGVATAVTCTFGTGTTCGGGDTTHSFTTVNTDLLDISVTTQAAETLTQMACSLEKY